MIHPWWTQEATWSKHQSSNTIYHYSKVGIGTAQGREALTVVGNIQVQTIILVLLVLIVLHPGGGQHPQPFRCAAKAGNLCTGHSHTAA